MDNASSNSITEITRRAIFKEMRQQNFQWWGESNETDLLGRVFDLESMESYDHRLPNAARDIAVHRDYHTDWVNDWIFHDERFDLKHCDDLVLLRLFEVMVHPTVQPDREQVKWLVNLLNLHLVHDGWRFEQTSAISGRPVYEASRIDPAELAERDRYMIECEINLDLESLLYSASRVFAHRGQTTEVAIIADASAKLTQISYDNWEGGTYGYALHLLISPALYAQIADDRLAFANVIRDEIHSHFPYNRVLYEVLIHPYQKAPIGWQNKAKTWVGGKGVTNQGRVRSTNIAGREHDGLLFRSQAEINLYDALKEQGVAFAPLPVFLRGGKSYQRLEPDFVVFKDGVFAVVEVDGDSFHPETPSGARARLKLLEDAGAYIMRVNASDCGNAESAATCAKGILRDIETQKNNRR